MARPAARRTVRRRAPRSSAARAATRSRRSTSPTRSMIASCRWIHGRRRWTRQGSTYMPFLSPPRWSTGRRRRSASRCRRRSTTPPAAAHKKHPERCFGLAMLPMQDPALALKELERAAKLPGMRGVYLATNVNGRNWTTSSFWHVYGKCEELGWTALPAPGGHHRPGAHEEVLPEEPCGNPYDTGIAAAHLIFGGVLDAFPEARVQPAARRRRAAGPDRPLDRGTKVRAE